PATSSADQREPSSSTSIDLRSPSYENAYVAVASPGRHSTESPSASSGGSTRGRAASGGFTPTSPGAPGAARACGAEYGGPPTGGGSPSTRSRERFPTTATLMSDIFSR